MVLSREIDIAFRAIYALLIVVNIAGNVLVCLVIRRFSFIRSPMNYLIAHVAICDIISGIFLSLKAVLFGLYEHPSGLLGDFLCKFVTFGQLGWIPNCASVYTLLAIAWERYKAILKPHSPRFSNKQVKRAIIISWIIAFFICLPELVSSGYNLRIKSCDFFWIGRWDSLLDPTIWLIGVGLVPPFIMTVLYGKVVRSLWCTRNTAVAGDVTQRSLLKSRKRVTQSVILVTVLLFLCWSPILLNYIISSYSSDNNLTMENINQVVPLFYQISYVFVILNSTLNPFIYALRDKRFRKCMIQILLGDLSNDVVPASVGN